MSFRHRHTDAAPGPGSPPTQGAAPGIARQRQPAAATSTLPFAGAAAGKARSRPMLIAAAAVFLLAVVARLVFIDRAYDLFIDEITYTELGRSIAGGHGVGLWGHPFHLHPPLLFVVLAVLMRVFGMDGDTTSVVLALRPAVAVLGAVTCALVTVLLARVTRLRIGVLAGVFAAVDPFLVRFDSRVLLEAPAMTAATVAVLLLTVAVSVRRGAAAVAAAAGVAMAAAITTKELYVFVTVVPVAVLAVCWRGRHRRHAVIAGVVACVGYLGYVGWVAAAGDAGTWWAQKTYGVQRALGAEQITGFNRPGSVSFTGRLAANAPHLAVTYLVMLTGAACTVALLIAWARRVPAARQPHVSLVAVWSAGALAFTGYAMAFGTLEEQMFYPVVVTAIAVSAVAAHAAIVSRPHRHAATARPRRRPLMLAAAAVVVLLGVQSAVWAGVHTRHDDAYARLTAWCRTNLPDGTTVAVTDSAAQFLLTGLRLGRWSDQSAIVANDVDYVLVGTEVTRQGYGEATPALRRWLDDHAPVAFRAAGPTNGELRLYDVRRIVDDTKAGR